MSHSRRETLLDDLPEEIIVDGILLRLPPMDVGRCRTVCTAWRAATSTPEFMLKHHRRQPSLPIIDWMRRPHTCALTGARPSCRRLWPFLPGEEKRQRKMNDNELRATCDGFLIVYRIPEQFYVCNPVTRKHALLPQPQDQKPFHNNIVGFYRYHPTGEYRVLWVSSLSNGYTAYVLTVGFDKPKNVTLAFWGGSTPSFTTMDVWVMQDYESEIWTSRYRIDVSMLEASRKLYLTSLEYETPLDSTVVQQLGGMAVLSEPELLIMFNDKHVLRCDIDGKYLGNLSYGKYLGKSQPCRWLTGHRLQESIAPIPCHEMQAEDEEDPFS